MAGLEQRVGSAVHADQHRAELPDVRPQRRQVVLVVVAADDDEHVPAVHLGADLRHADAVEQQLTLAAEELHRVGRERLQLHGQPGPASTMAADTVSGVCTTPSATSRSPT